MDKDRNREQYDIDVLADHASHTMHVMLSVIMVLCAMLIVSICVVLYQHRQFTEALQAEHAQYIDLLESIEETETYEYDIEQDADDNGRNYFVGRDLRLYGDEATSNGQSDQDPNP